MDDGLVEEERLDAAERALGPGAVGLTDPPPGCETPAERSHVQPVLTPELAAAIAAVVMKCEVRAVRDRRHVDAERGQDDLVRGTLVVVRE